MDRILKSNDGKSHYFIINKGDTVTMEFPNADALHKSDFTAVQADFVMEFPHARAVKLTSSKDGQNFSFKPHWGITS